MAITPTLIYMFLQYRHQRARVVKFYPVIYSLWRLDTAARTYIAVPCFQVLHSIP